MRALSIIQAEHRSMLMVADAMLLLSKKLKLASADETTISTLELAVKYFDTFTKAFHHEKEDRFLYDKLRARVTRGANVLETLARDHEMESVHLARIQDLLIGARSHRNDAEKKLAAEIESYCERLRRHMQLEENESYDLARREFSAADWIDIDREFSAHQDPLIHAAEKEEIGQLRARLVQILPEPLGLGGHSESLPQFDAISGAANCSTLVIDGLSSDYGHIRALHDISLSVKEGQIVALVGANGAGKTTLLRCVSGVQQMTCGAIAAFGSDISKWRPENRVAGGICHVPEGRQVFGPMTIEDNLILGAYTQPMADLKVHLDEVYTLFPILKEKRRLLAGTLSGGQQQMLALGRALMGRPRILLLDEPSMGLAPLIVEEIFRTIEMLRSRGITILLVEQNAYAALAIADYGYVLEAGAIVLEGFGQQLLENEDVKRAYLGM